MKLFLRAHGVYRVGGNFFARAFSKDGTRVRVFIAIPEGEVLLRLMIGEEDVDLDPPVWMRVSEDSLVHWDYISGDPQGFSIRVEEEE